MRIIMLMSSLIDNISQLTSVQDSKLIFKTELNSLEITRSKPKLLKQDYRVIYEVPPDPPPLIPMEPLQPSPSPPPTPRPPCPRRYNCDMCGYTTNKKSNHDKHMKCVHFKEKYDCQLCSKKVSNLPQHMRVTHLTPSPNATTSSAVRAEPNDQKRQIVVPPQYCWTGESKKKEQKVVEKRTVKEPTKKMCTQCNKLYSNLEQHVKIVHEKIKNFECVNCKKRFYDNRELRNHHLKSLQTGQCQQLINIKVKKHKCEQCEYRASSRSNLLTHVKSVHLKLKYECPACQLLLASKPNLNNHFKNCKKYQALHPGERDYKRILFQCKLCDYSTPRPSHLDRHILSVHGVEALETVTSVYQNSNRTSIEGSRAPFKLPQFVNLVNFESIEGLLNLDDTYGSSLDLNSSVQDSSLDLHSIVQDSSLGLQSPVQDSSLDLLPPVDGSSPYSQSFGDPAQIVDGFGNPAQTVDRQSHHGFGNPVQIIDGQSHLLINQPQTYTQVVTGDHLQQQQQQPYVSANNDGKPVVPQTYSPDGQEYGQESQIKNSTLASRSGNSPAGHIVAHAGQNDSPVCHIVGPAGQNASPPGHIVSPAGQNSSPTGQNTSSAGHIVGPTAVGQIQLHLPIASPSHPGTQSYRSSMKISLQDLDGLDLLPFNTDGDIEIEKERDDDDPPDSKHKISDYILSQASLTGFSRVESSQASMSGYSRVEISQASLAGFSRVESSQASMASYSRVESSTTSNSSLTLSNTTVPGTNNIVTWEDSPRKVGFSSFYHAHRQLSGHYEPDSGHLGPQDRDRDQE